MTDSYDLDRFLSAQEGTYEQALAELRAGRKRGHWMWFVFPQIAGLGMSATSQRYAIGDLAEAQAYLAHPVLGARLLECAAAVVDSPESNAEAMFGGIDAVKLRSSMTLFCVAAPKEHVFTDVLDRFFDGALDSRTTDRL